MIGLATREDLPVIVEMALTIPARLGIEEFPEVDVGKVSERFLRHWGESPIFVYRNEEGKILGFVATIVDSPWWSNKRMLVDYAFYVDPDEGEYKIVSHLIDAMKDCAKLNGLLVTTHFISGTRTETKKKLFERKGFKINGFIANYG